jgi:hypothetical protein
MIGRRPTMWSNSTLLKGAATEAVATLDEQPAGNIVIPGGPELDLLVAACKTAEEAGTR